jgi:hypothetical protein
MILPLGLYIDKPKARRSIDLWANLDCRAVRCDPPELFDFLVGKRDATGGPILPTMKCAHPAKSISNSVDHDVKTGRDTALGSTCVIIIRRIGNVQRKMKAALRIPAVDLVDTFRRSHVALLFLRPDRASAQRNAVTLEPPAAAKERQFPCRFFDDDPIDRRSGGKGMPIVVRVEVNSQGQRTDHDKQQSDLANHIVSL